MEETFFRLANAAVLPAWILLLVLPRWRWTQRWAAVITPLALAVLYCAIFVRHYAFSSGGFSSLEAVSQLFSQPWILLAGWVHYLAFDLFIGAWEVRDAARLGLPHGVVVPCLILTFVLGPMGLLAYFVLRMGMRKTVEP
jgi:hypothetical protein